MPDDEVTSLAPLQRMLGAAAFDDLAPAVREHFAPATGIRRYQGALTIWRRRGLRGWLARPTLWLVRRAQLFVADAGVDVPLEMAHQMQRGTGGMLEMVWTRTLRFAHGEHRCQGVLAMHPTLAAAREWLGPSRTIEAQVTCHVISGELHTQTGRQWLHIAHFRILLPRWLCGTARLREWERPDGTLGTTLVLNNVILGDFMGWTGVLRHSFPSAECQRALAVTAGHPRVPE